MQRRDLFQRRGTLNLGLARRSQPHGIHFSRQRRCRRSGRVTHNQIRRYSVPAGLSPEEKFEHWRSWYGSAIDTPVRLEKTEKLVRPDFNPTALSLDGPGFSLVDVTNEPASCYWNADTNPSDWLVYFRTSCDKFSFSGRSEAVSPGTVRFFDLSLPGNFHAPAGLSAVRVHFDRGLLGLDDRAVKRLQGLADIRENPIMRGLILPALSGWQRTGIAQEMQRLQPVVRSMMTALVSSLARNHGRSRRS